jgi:dipeptidyl aminopeptidase/acylaminoacyl peptidase
MNKIVIIVCLLLMAAIRVPAQQPDFPKLTGPYLGQKPPGMTPEVFAPGIVSIEGIQSKLLVSSDGSEIIFKNMVVEGNSPADRKVSFVSIRMENGSWGLPVDIPFSTGYLNDEPTLSPDWKRLFFVSNRPKEGETETQRMPDIWVAERNSNGWSEPNNLGAPVNTEGLEVQPFLGTDNTLYFGRADGIYCSQFSDGQFSEPVKLDENIFKGRVRGICISPDNRTLIAHSDKPGGYGGWDLYVSFKDKEGNWTDLLTMGRVINTELPEANATFSSDGKYMFFSRGDDIYWVSTKIIEELKPKY